jgi:succinate-semialdehyde dehydrogenase
VQGPGFFYEPTVLSGVEPGMAAFDEEIFGPVAALTEARDVNHAIEFANCSEYGLSGNLWIRMLKIENKGRHNRRVRIGLKDE